MIKLTSYQLYFFLAILTFCFLFFQQADLFHTAISSYAYLSGHILDFYDFNKLFLEYNHYLPIIYAIFAIWNIPLSILGLTSPANGSNFAFELLIFPSSAIEIIWWKLLLVLFFVGSVYLVAAISKKINHSLINKNLSASTLFATSPFVVFSVFLLGGYDIISVFFTLLGILFYFKQDKLKFSIFFSIAISLKFFAAVIFLPLLLIAEKNLFKIIGWGLLASSFTLLQILIYIQHPVFLNEVFSMVFHKAQSHSTLKIIFKLSVASLYVFFCFYLYFKKIKDLNEFYKFAVFVPLFSYSLMFVAITWHPQWIIIMCPFLAFSFMYIKQTRMLLAFEALAMIALTWYVVNAWKGNIDLSMLTIGPLQSFIVKPDFLMSDIFHGFRALFRWAFTLYFFAPILLLCYESKFMTKFKSQAISQNLIVSRLFIGLSFFILPTLVVIFKSF